MPITKRGFWRCAELRSKPILRAIGLQMSTLMPFLVLDQSCEQTLTWVNEKLAGASLHLTQTFNLQVARLAHPDCLCPQHDSSSCDCQMLVLLVYGKQEIPSTLIIQGKDSRCWISLPGPFGKHSNQHLDVVIRRMLIPPPLSLPSPLEAPDEIRTTF